MTFRVGDRAYWRDERDDRLYRVHVVDLLPRMDSPADVYEVMVIDDGPEYYMTAYEYELTHQS